MPTPTPIPRDEALPQMQQLLDPEAIAPVLASTLGPEAELGNVTINYLRYKPGLNLCVHYTADVSGTPCDAVAFLAPQEDLLAVSQRPEYVHRAGKAAARSPAPEPLTYDPALGVLLHWLPFELDLIALAEPPAVVRNRLIEAGAPLGGTDQLEMLQYRPRRRAALRLGGYVAKLYRDEAGYTAGVAGLDASRRMGAIRTARRVAVVPEWLLTLQEWLPGEPPARRASAARDAGALLREMHATNLEGLDPLLPKHRLKAAATSVAIVSIVAPALASRAAALLRELERSAPLVDGVVSSHGDFHGGQLLVQPEGLAVIDFDLLGSAPPAFDLATYAGHLVPKEAPDIDAAATALDELVEGYGARPPWLAWYLSISILRRARVPFRNFDHDWPEGVETMLGAAEAALRL